MARRNVASDFNRNWNDYKTGFGNVTSDHWIGETAHIQM